MADRISETLELVRQSQAGDTAALDTLFGRYYPRVLKVIRLRMGAKLRTRLESADILQDTFGAAIKGFDSFEMRSEASFINWLSTIAQSVLRDNADKVSAQKRDPNREVPLSREDLYPGFVVPLDQLLRAEEQEILDACIAELPEHYRECIVLRNYIGLSFKEIATQTERPSEGAARMMHAKAMSELAERVRRYR